MDDLDTLIFEIEEWSGRWWESIYYKANWDLDAILDKYRDESNG